MRRHYGIKHWRAFEEGKDPERLRGENAAGETICQDAMMWYAKMVFLKNIIAKS